MSVIQDMAARGSTVAVVCLLLVAATTGATVKLQPFGLEESIDGEFAPEDTEVDWLNGTAMVYKNGSEVVVLDLSTGDSAIVVPTEIFEHFQPNLTKLSADERFVLLGYDVQRVFRQPPVARYVAYNIEENSTTPIGGGERLQLVEWGPVDSALVYVHKNNIYYLSEPTAKPVQVTSDGVPGVVFNGIADENSEDTLSPEDSLGDDGAVWWSLDGTQLVYAQYNDSRRRNASMMHYGKPGDLRDQYASVVTFRYSKVGTPNPTILVKLATLPTEKSTSVTIQELLPPIDVVGEDNSPDDVSWVDETSLLVSWKNRLSNVKQYVKFATTSTSKRLRGRKGLKLEEKDGWLDSQTSFFKSDNTATFLTVMREPQDKAGSFPHVVAVTGTSKKALTSGEVTVTELYGWADNGIIYYQATEKGEPSTRQVYALKEGGTPRCLSCGVTSPEGHKCKRASATFSTDFSWYALKCTGPDPSVISLYSVDPKESMWEWITNEDLREKLTHKQLPQRLDDWVDVGDGLRAQVRMWLPPGLDPKGSEKRPALVEVYAGPDSQQIDDSFSVDYYSYWTTSQRYVYVLIDGRGSGCKGSKTLFAVHNRLGSVEVQDQINVMRELKKRYPFIDGSRTGIWGWSYGGYVTAMALAQDEHDVFQCGVSVAPVTSWIYYDSRYTEPYMGPLSANEAGYTAGDVTRLANRFANKTFLLIHGSADDNVHYQHSMMLARALEDAGVLFSQQVYPDQDHTMRDLSYHMYRSVYKFFQECFEKQPTPASSALRISGGLMFAIFIVIFVV